MKKYSEKEIVIISSFILLVLISMIGIKYRFFSDEVKKENIIRENVGSLAIFVNDELVNEIDKYQNYEMTEYDCTNGAKIEWDITTSSATIKNFSKTAQCTIYLTESEIQTLYNKIIKDNSGGTSDAEIDFSISSSSTNGQGLYYTADATVSDYGEDGERIYYYRGDIDNNWVTFGGYKWRILRTTSEKGVKLAYSGNGSGATAALINSSVAYNTAYSTKYTVGYTYNTSGYTGTQTNSSVKTKIDTWYGTWKTNNPAVPNYLSNTAVFCNDRSEEQDILGGPWTSDAIYYPAHNRLANEKRPSFACPYINQSRYTVSITTGNGYLTNPIALLTGDEINYSGLMYKESTISSSYIMDNATSNHWWTMTPNGFNPSGGAAGNSKAGMWLFSSSFQLGAGSVQNTGYATRPVVALKSCVTYTGVGDGSQTTPYQISADNC